MNDKVVITCALTVPAQSKGIPITVEQIVDEGVIPAEAGASVVHVHVREELTGRPVADLDLFESVLSELRKNTDAVLQPTTGGGRRMTVEERASVLNFSPRRPSSILAVSTSDCSPSPPEICRSPMWN